MRRVIVFNIFGDYAHFKKYFTTSSPLSFTFPPPPTIAGILGAICGVDKDSYLEVFSHDRCRVAVSIKKPVKKVRMGINHINTKNNFWIPVKKKNHEPRTQVRFELIKQPFYRIYVAHKDEEISKKLEKNLREHKSEFTVSLGLSELLADFEFCGSYLYEELKPDEAMSISTVIPIEAIQKDGIEIERGRMYLKDRIPVVMGKDREVMDYKDIVFEANAKQIKSKLNVCFQLENGENIVFI